MRKADFAAVVTSNTPHMDTAWWLLRFNFCNNNGLFMLQNCWPAAHMCGIIICTYYGESMPVRSRSKSQKLEALREEGTLNPTPDEVRDPKFQENEFFDPHAATVEYGVSRPIAHS